MWDVINEVVIMPNFDKYDKVYITDITINDYNKINNT